MYVPKDNISIFSIKTLILQLIDREGEILHLSFLKRVTLNMYQTSVNIIIFWNADMCRFLGLTP